MFKNFYIFSTRTGNDGAIARNLVAVMLAQLAQLGWRLLCCVDVSAKLYIKNINKEGPSSMDGQSMFFVQSAGVAAGGGGGQQQMHFNVCFVL